MSADIKKKSSIPQDALSTEDYSIQKSMILNQKTIDITSRFYLEFSKNVLSKREYSILEKILIQNSTLNNVCEDYGITVERIQQINNQTFLKIQSVLELFKNIEIPKETKVSLQDELLPQKKQIRNKILDKKIIDSSFPFSRRLWNILNLIDCHTLQDLTAEALENYLKIKGFKGKCMKELLQYIEFENIEEEFDSFHRFKRIYNS